MLNLLTVGCSAAGFGVLYVNSNGNSGKLFKPAWTSWAFAALKHSKIPSVVTSDKMKERGKPHIQHTLHKIHNICYI